jgi:hypothetical protein
MISRSVNDPSRVIRMMIVGDTTTWSVLLTTRAVIYDYNIAIIQADLLIQLDLQHHLGSTKILGQPVGGKQPY